MTALLSSRTDILHSGARKSLLSRLLDMNALYRQRRALSRLDDSRLADLGLTRAEARAEAKRPIWDAPTFWLQ